MHSALSTIVPIKRLPDFLPRALPWLERTLRIWGYHIWTLESLVEALYNGSLQLWAGRCDGKDLFVITELTPEPAGRTAHIVLGGGELDDELAILEHIAGIETWAKTLGATSMVIWGRLGWKKPLTKYGYQFESASFRHVFPERMN